MKEVTRLLMSSEYRFVSHGYVVRVGGPRYQIVCTCGHQRWYWIADDACEELEYHVATCSPTTTEEAPGS